MRFEGGTVMVADDVRHFRLFHGAFDMREQVKSLVILRVLGTLRGGQHTVEFHSDELGVHHLVLGISRMDVLALDVDVGTGGVEVLEL